MSLGVGLEAEIKGKKLKNFKGGENMADENKELEQFLQDLLDEEQKRHEEFLKGHWELMQMIEEARKEMHKYD